MTLLKRYLATSYEYYVNDNSLMSDADFDALCRDLLALWDKLPSTWHQILSKESLEAGTGYDLKYPKDIEEIVEEFKESLLD